MIVSACHNAAKISPRGSSWPSSICQVWNVFPAHHSVQVLSYGGHAERLSCYVAQGASHAQGRTSIGCHGVAVSVWGLPQAGGHSSPIFGDSKNGQCRACPVIHRLKAQRNRYHHCQKHQHSAPYVKATPFISMSSATWGTRGACTAQTRVLRRQHEVAGHWEGLHNPVAQQQKWALPVQHRSQHAMPLMFV